MSDVSPIRPPVEAAPEPAHSLSAGAAITGAWSIEDAPITVVLAATGNVLKSHDGYDTFMEVTMGGPEDGNQGPGEVHVLIRCNDGSMFAQGWFKAADLLGALGVDEAHKQRRQG